jgi:hypothetical protein
MSAQWAGVGAGGPAPPGLLPPPVLTSPHGVLIVMPRAPSNYYMYVLPTN